MKIIKNNKYKILAFLLPIIIFSIIYFIKGLFGKYVFLTSDAIAQYYPTYKYLYNVLHGDATFPYTFSKGLGGTMYGAFFYGISSPMNIFIYFFKDVKLFMLLSTLLKIGLSGLTMFSFLKNEKHKPINCLIFSLAYALSGYVIIYGVNIMWLDSVWLAPLVLLGINKIIYDKKDWLYIISLFTTLISNYYTGYMVVLFSVLYFIYKIYTLNEDKHFIKNNIKLIIHFFIITLLIGGLIAFMLLPIYFESKDFARFSNNIHIINFNYLSLFTGSYVGFGNITNPLNDFSIIYYCGTVMIPLIIYYFSSKSISKKEKKASFIMLLLMLLPVIIMPLSYIWHLFTYPQAFNFRYSFLLVLFMLYIAIKSFEKMDGNNKWLKLYYIVYTFISISILYANSQVPDYYNYLNIYIVIFTLIIVLVNIILITKKKNIIILILLTIELITNVSYIYYHSNIIKTKSLNEFENKYIYTGINYKSDEYRTETRPLVTMNNSLAYNYNGVTVFLSSANKKALNVYFRLYGNKISVNYTMYMRKHIFVDTLLGVKYSVTPELNTNYITEKTIDGDDIYYIQKNPYAFSLGFNATESIKDLDTTKFEDKEYINDIINSIVGNKDNYFIKLNVEKKNNKHYIIDNTKNYNEIYVLTNKKFDDDIDTTYTVAEEYIMVMDSKKSSIDLLFEKDTDEFEVYAFNAEKFIKNVSNIKQMKIEYNKGNELKATIDSNNTVLATTIPYEKGWSIYVDGKKVDYYKILDSFIGIDISEGKHEIYFRYEIPGFKLGLIISLIDLIVFIVYKLKYKLI